MSNNPHANTLLVVRNGIFSNPGEMANLQGYLLRQFPRCIPAHDPAYSWKKPVLHSGIDLAELVLQLMKTNPGIDKIILVGHSQGGLVCRVAAAALCEHASFLGTVRDRKANDPKYFRYAEERLESIGQDHEPQLARARKAVHSVVMLATPNAGAMTNGQLSLEATFVLRGLKKLGEVLGLYSFDELTTEKLFRVLQNLRVARVRYVSISGSYFNRYKALGWSSLSDLPVGFRLAPSLELPNDTVVEDSSVDLREAPLPPEIDDLDTQYTHVRAYTDCLLTHHLSIHSDKTVFDALDLVPGWK